ncbi:MAG: hypothetical protein IKK50_07240 [Ruminiclostridium sp.]|nr:hypothetical protein [Ruminiclostridium sp.]
MDPRFTEYGAAVCTFVRHATAKEKEAIRKELADHMADHAQALMDGGYPEDHAARVALESMGDPETVGRALDKEYPLRWLVLSRILIGVVALLSLFYLMYLPLLGDLPEAIYARLDPEKGDQYEELHESFQPLDIRWELPGETILRFYGVTLQGANDQYTATVYASFYPKNPLSRHWNHVNILGFSYTLNGVEYPYHSSYGSGGYMYYQYAVDGLPEGCSLTAHYDRFGTYLETEIPLDWEVASP